MRFTAPRVGQFLFVFFLISAARSSANSTPCSIAFTPLEKVVGSAQIVGLGESLHGSDGFHHKKVEISKFLIEHKGFRAVAMETPWGTARNVDRYLQGETNSADKATLSLNGIWQSTTVRDFLIWIREFNEAHPLDPVHLIGYDITNPLHDLQLIRQALEKLVPAQTEGLMSVLQTGYGSGFKTEEDFHKSPTLLRPFDPNDPFSESNFAKAMTGIDFLRRYISNLKISTNEQRRYQVQAQIALASFGHEQITAYMMLRNPPKMYEARDLGGANVLLAGRQEFTNNAKTILWAHNQHILLKNESVTRMDQNGTAPFPVKALGGHLSDQLGSKYIAIAIVGYDVKVNFNGLPQVAPTSNPNSLELRLHLLGSKELFLDPEVLQKGREYLVGGYWIIPAEQYNGFVFLKPI